METIIFDGKKCSEEKRESIKEYVQIFKDECDYVPKLAIILANDDPGSISYVKGKTKAIEEVGMDFELIKYDPTKLGKNELFEEISYDIQMLNHRKDIHGILIQLPLPKGINEDLLLSQINPKKDVDGITAQNMGNMLLDKGISDDFSYFIPCTPKGIVYILEKYNIETENKNIVVIGRSNIVGKPIANLLSKNNINGNVTLLHSKTKNLKDYTKNADILILAAGKVGLLTEDMVKYGAIVIDVGVNRIKSDKTKSGWKLVGDCDFENVKDKCSFITPVPGGVGPMTITMLLDNVLQAAFLASNEDPKIFKQLK